MNNQVFVYGSLKRGFGNHRLLSSSRFVCSSVTKDACFHMFSLSSFPGVHKKGASKITGEVYKVDDITFKNLDHLEGHPGFYRREQVAIEGVDGLCWMYLLDEEGGEKTDGRVVEDYIDGFNIQTWE